MVDGPFYYRINHNYSHCRWEDMKVFHRWLTSYVLFGAVVSTSANPRPLSEHQHHCLYHHPNSIILQLYCSHGLMMQYTYLFHSGIPALKGPCAVYRACIIKQMRRFHLTNDIEKCYTAQKAAFKKTCS